MLVGGSSKMCRTASLMARTSGGETPRVGRESQREDEDTYVKLVRSFMRLNMRVEQACEHAGGTVAPVYEYSGHCFKRDGKVPQHMRRGLRDKQDSGLRGGELD